MGDDFDPCECIFNHEMAMRRLLSLLRSSQSYCQDNECLQDGALPGPGESTGPDTSFFMMAIGWMVLAVAMYLMRPNSLRNSGDGKPSNNGNGGGGAGGAGGPRDPDPPAVM